ncbi:RNA-guided pseudouridylation complex pseudouridine synthase subunit Cbf5 [Candidatus Woesearchaeota archaeon]|nr:RNA-guided pseudouridylation complex pseudouridine synthase subunit Cbf5 [Candidatus Woesearchaeota archaeon]MBI2130580.1 RNA-guided pseudouridylation complex pseudouridine synthase subunit Cbf5 [Candidatus Woesearchaeota archaeon]MBI2661250.1 RNA-guided pseudouridylation complex pseudouridine synthase subunit Cbf5 [Candidatus Woesearchaeota archaeon]
METLLPFEKIERKIIVKKESGTDSRFGCRPEDRPTRELVNYGVVNIDKPKGPTSHQVADFAKKILHLSKSGHSGTLDPAVTGVLVIALGDATRIAQALLKAGKEYVAIMHLHKEVEEKRLREVCNAFTGKIQQMPPIKSAVKRQLRTRSVYYLDIIEIDGQDVMFRVGTEAGTYIRKLIHDIGAKLATGAHMAELRRTKAGPFGESTLFTLQDLADAYHYWKEEKNEKYIRKIIQPVENAVAHLPKIWVFDATIGSLCHGIDLKIPGISRLHSKISTNDLVAIMSLKDELVAMGEAKMSSEHMMRESRGLAVKTHKVFMKPGVYPKNAPAH